MNSNSVEFTNLLFDDYVSIKSNLKNCLLTNAVEQFIFCGGEKKDNFEFFEIDNGIKIAISKEELKIIKDNFPNTCCIVSPYLLLYKFFMIEPIENALWILNQEKFITLIVVKDKKIVFGKHIKKQENFIIEEYIKEAIKDFYKSECCYFLENIFLYDSLKDDETKKIKDATLLEVKRYPINLKDEIKSICNKGEFLINIETKKKFFIPNVVKYSIISIFVILIGIDLFFKYANSKLESKLENIQNEKVFLKKNIEYLTKKISTIKLITPTIQDIKSSNSLVKSNIKDIFDLIPDSITLNRAEIGKNFLILDGFTTSKKEFYKLDRTLKSFYQTRDVKFQRVKNGYLFLSIDKEIEANNAK